MSSSKDEAPVSDGDSSGNRPLSDAARRALAEAAERRRLADATRGEPAKEYGGQAGPDPARYGDWEKGGIVSDF